MKLFIKLFVVLLFMSSNTLTAQNIKGFLPPVLPGWQLQREDKIYNPETLYDYIDGGAELFLSYGMNEVISRIITKDENEIRIEIFDMIEARNAFGVFTNTRQKDEQQYGQGSQYYTGVQIFWKDKYYIAITANDENETIIDAIRILASSIDTKIVNRGDIPPVIDLLPKEGLQPDGYVYFHHYIWLNAQYYIADDNFLNIDSSTPSVSAKYYENNNRIYLLVIQYPDKKMAEQSYAAFRKKFLADSPDNYALIEDNTWLGGKLFDSKLICVFNAKSYELATELLNRVINQH